MSRFLVGVLVSLSLAAEVWATGLGGYYVFHSIQGIKAYELDLNSNVFSPIFSFQPISGFGYLQDIVILNQRRPNQKLVPKLYYLDVTGRLMEVDPSGSVAMVPNVHELLKVAHWGTDILLGLDRPGYVFKVVFDLVTGKATCQTPFLQILYASRVKRIRAHGYSSIAVLFEDHLSIWDYSVSPAVETVHNLPAGLKAKDFIGDSLSESLGTAHTFWIQGDNELALYDTSSQRILTSLPFTNNLALDLFAWDQGKRELFFRQSSDLGHWSAGNVTVQPWGVANHSVHPDFNLPHSRVAVGYHLDSTSAKMTAFMVGGPRTNAPKAVASARAPVNESIINLKKSNPTEYIRNLAKTWWQQVHGKGSELPKLIDRLTLCHIVNGTQLKELLLVQMDAGRVLIADLAALELIMRFGELYVVPENQAGLISLDDFLALLTRDSSAASSCLDRLFPRWNNPSVMFFDFDQFPLYTPSQRP